ncbi:hypothetical protein RchiOBHm_Chr1g0343931 [Rosa chinensis]|uniref:Uncharacterized protein n=1 Tax=Rosa chinensis TaxID=74649 RepID=A0A2P6SEE9_ROSCH|nr:hypothetical protein RchiOBHm_Chr1g0343931 [Rosa chinensis]
MCIKFERERERERERSKSELRGRRRRTCAGFWGHFYIEVEVLRMVMMYVHVSSL